MAHHVKQSACANCAYPFQPEEPDEFCPRCGQQNHDINLSVGHVLEEGLEGVFHFDSKVFRTLGLLLFKPGQLTRRFLAGQRVPYVPPIRLYVFISFLFFLVLSLQSNHGSRKPLREVFSEGQRQVQASGRAGRIEPLPGLVINTAPDTATLHRAAVRLRQRARQGDQKAADELVRLAAAEKILTGQRPAGPRPPVVARGGREEFDISQVDFAKLPEELSPAQVDSLIRSGGEEPTYFTRLSVRRYARWRDATTEEVVHQGLRGASIMMFLLMPLAALLLKGAYFRQHRYYISHLIFTVHMHCFLFLLLTFSNALQLIPRLHIPNALPWLVTAVYFIVALHTFYQQGWGRTVAKSLLLGVAYVLVLGFSAVSILALGVAVF